MNLLLIDQPIRNRGDESAHKALVRRLLSALEDGTITVPYRYSRQAMEPMMVRSDRVRYVRVAPDIFSYRCRLWGQKFGLRFLWRLDPAIRRLVKLYKEADWVVASPGGVNLGGFQDRKHLFFLQLARYLGKPLAYYGRSLGPFPAQTPPQREFAREAFSILEYMDYVSVRDRLSDVYVQGAVKTLDTAFLETPEASVPDTLPEGPYVVFVPNSLTWHFAFKTLPQERVDGFFKEIAALIHQRFPAHRIVYLPQLYGGETLPERDRDYFLGLAEGDDFVAPETWSSDIQQAVIRGSACVVGARYHSIVFAINNAVPYLALSYEHKMAGLCQSLDAPYVDISTLDTALVKKALAQVTLRPSDSVRAKEMAEKGFSTFLSYLKRECRVSVIVPNYNYARFLDQRLESILNQTCKPYEIIVLDDASTDHSLEVLQRYQGSIRLVVNVTNSGSPFKQWKKGLELVSGDLVWIAEADDFATPGFLEEAIKPFREDPFCKLSFVRSQLAEPDGKAQGLHPNQAEMDQSFKMDGMRFIGRYLARRNAVVNASACVFQRKAALQAASDYESYGGSGDIIFWAEIARQGRVAYSSAQESFFRIHGNNRTLEHSTSGKGELEAARVNDYMLKHGWIGRLGHLGVKVYHYVSHPECADIWGGSLVPALAAVKKFWKWLT